MNTLIEKIKVIYLPFLIIFVGFVSLYTFLHWFLIIDKELIALKEDTLKFWLPFALPFIPIYIWLRPRVNLLIFKKDDYYYLYQFLALGSICVTTMITQEYLIVATGKLTELDNISEINKKEITKYYTLKNFHLDKKSAVPYGTYEVSGKHREQLNFHVYCIVPIFPDTLNSPQFTCLAWLGAKKTKTVSNKLDESQKKVIYDEFYKNTWDSFNKEDLSQFTYLENLGNANDIDDFEAAIERSPAYKETDIIVLKAINQPFEARYGDKFKWIFLSFGIGSFIWLILLFFPAINISKLRAYKEGKLPSEKSDLVEILEFLIPKNDFFITPIIININILIYLIMTIYGLGFISFQGYDLLTWGANFRPSVLKGEWWRLVTSVFLHGGIMHILANMYGLVFVGIFLEPALGRTKYFIVYILTGIIASLSSIWWYKATVSVGASGAIFGLYGVFLALLLTNFFSKDIKVSFLISTSIFIGFNLVMGLTGGIDNAAHIGGLLSGFIMGFLLYPFLKK